LAIVGLTVVNSTFVILLGIGANVGLTFFKCPTIANTQTVGCYKTGPKIFTMKKHILIFATLTAFIISCQKEISVENETTPTPTTDDSIYISKVIALDTSKVAPLDTVYIATYGYDNLKRVISYSYLTYNNTGIVDSAYCLLATKIYNGNDTIPYKQIAWFKETSSKWVDTSYYQYVTGTSTLIYDSTIERTIQPQSTDLFTFAEKYSRINNSLSRNIANYQNNIFTNSDVFTYNFITQNNNIVNQQDDAWGSSNSFICTYDTKSNPFSRPGTSSYLSSVFFDMKIGDTDADPTFYEQKNNVIEITNTSLPSTTHYKFDYQYNSKNYPTEIVIQDIGSSNNFNLKVNKIKLKYTN